MRMAKPKSKAPPFRSLQAPASLLQTPLRPPSRSDTATEGNLAVSASPMQPPPSRTSAAPDHAAVVPDDGDDRCEGNDRCENEQPPRYPFVSLQHGRGRVPGGPKASRPLR